MQLVITHKEKVTTTSRLVAEKFEKEHKDVLRAIRELDCSEDFSRRNFTPSTYSVRGKEYSEFIISRDGFSFLVMSFTGSRAAKFKEAFIDEFNRMEDILRQGKTPVLIPTYQRRVLSEPTKSCLSNYWSIFDQSHSIMFLIETHIGSVNEYDLIDGSIGVRWSSYRKDKPWAVESSKYQHEYNDVRGTRECKCYKYSELEFFKEWLKTKYKPEHLYEYLSNKYKKEKNVLMIDKVNEFLPKVLAA